MNSNQVLSVASPPVRAAELSLLDWNGWGVEIRLGLVWLLVVVVLAAGVCWLLPLVRLRLSPGFRTHFCHVLF